MLEVPKSFDTNTDFIRHVLSDEFPWFYPTETWNQVEAHYHLLISRNVRDPKVVSEYFHPFYELFKSFCENNFIKVDSVFGAAVHQTLPSTKVAQNFHVDFPFPHRVLIMYLTDEFEAGRTLVSDAFKTPDSPMVTSDVLESVGVKAEAGKVLCFDGLRYHAGEYPVDGRRVVCIFTFT
jgi:hypothetical protein